MALSLEERMKISYRRNEVDELGLPRYTRFENVPKGLVTKTTAKKMKQPIGKHEEPVAFVLCPAWNGYLPLYDRQHQKKERWL